MLCKHWSFAPTALCGRHAYDAVRDSFSALLSVSAPGFSRTGGAGSETSGGSSQPAAARPTVAPSRRPPAVGLALPSLDALPQGDGAGQAGNCSPMAPVKDSAGIGAGAHDRNAPEGRV